LLFIEENYTGIPRGTRRKLHQEYQEVPEKSCIWVIYANKQTNFLGHAAKPI